MDVGSGLVSRSLAILIGSHTRWCPFDSVQLVQITPITMVFVGDISTVFMGL